MRNKSTNQTGFTLIELLVVIAIIGVLSSSVYAIIGGSRMRAKFASRVVQVQTIAKALDLYFAANGTYPPIANGQPGRYLSFDGLTLFNGYLGAFTIVRSDPNSAIWLYYWDNPGGATGYVAWGGPSCIILDGGYLLMLLPFTGGDPIVQSTDGGVTDTAYERFGGGFKKGTFNGTSCNQ